jgi:hypothetical protein
MLVDFPMVIKVTSLPKTWQNKQLLNVPISHNNHKRYPKKNVVLTSFVGKITTVVIRR